MKAFLSSFAAVALSFLFISCSKEESNRPLRFVTGGEAGTYYAFGSVIAQHITNFGGVQVISQSGNGSQSNVLAMEDGTADMGFCQSDVMTCAYNGTNTFKNLGKITSFSVLGALYQEQVQMITLDENIRTVADLKGKTVSIGASGSGTYFNAIDLLEVYGLSERDIVPTYQSFGDSANALKDGKIDAAFIVAGAPTTAVMDLKTVRKVHLISVDQAHTDALIAKKPYYSRATISKDVYKTDADIQTVAIAAVILVRNDLPELTVSKICSDIFNNSASLGDLHAKYYEVSIGFGASMTSVPYHPGAAKYFKTKGVTVSSVVGQ